MVLPLIPYFYQLETTVRRVVTIERSYYTPILKNAKHFNRTIVRDIMNLEHQ